MKSIAFALPVLSTILLGACGGSDDGTLIVGHGDLLVSGTINREETAQSDNDPFVPAAGAHLVLSLRRTGTSDITVPSFESDTAYRSLPLTFELHGKPTEIFPDASQLSVTAVYYNHAGTTAAVGDLSTEATYTVSKAGDHVDLLVSGLELCTAPESGGNCIAVGSLDN